MSSVPAETLDQTPLTNGPDRTGPAGPPSLLGRPRAKNSWPTPLARILRWSLLPALLILWQIAGSNVSSLLIPTPVDVVIALWKMTVSGEILEALWLSNQSLLIGTTAAIILGIPFGVLLGRSRLANRLLGIYVDLDLATPSVALLPLIILVFGLGLTARSIVVFTFSFPLIVAMVRAGSRTVDPRFLEMGAAYGASTRQLWMKVLLPGMLPTLAGAIRVGVSRGVVGMIIVELTLVTVGLGGLIMEATSLFHSDRLFAGVVVVCLEGILLIWLAGLLEKKIAPRGLYATEGKSE